MSVTAKKYTWGVKVYLAQALTEDGDIGLYVESFGAANTQIDITNPSGSTFRYTWDGTGTDPNFLTNGMNIGDVVVINSTNFNAANNGTFRVTASADGYFEITNASGVAENNKTLGSTTAIKSAHQFRWIQNTVTTTKTWKQGILTDKAIAPIEQEADFKTTGNPAQVRGTTISIKNIDGTTPLWKTLVDAGVNLIGKKLQIIEFDHSTNPATETILGTYIVDGAPKWSESAISINAVSAYYKRDILIGALVDNSPGGNYPNASDDSNGLLIPITFGRMFEASGYIGGLAKLPRVNNSGAAWVASESVNITGVSPAGQNSYPVTSIDSATEFRILASLDTITAVDLTAFQNELINKYVHVLSDINNKGYYRKITGVSIAASGILILTIESPFKAQLQVAGSSIGAIIQITDDAREFIADTFPTIGPVETNGGRLITDPICMISADSGFTRLPEGSFTIKAGTDNNVITVDLQIAYNEPDRFISVLSVPFASIAKDTASYELLSGIRYDKAADGLYKQQYFTTSSLGIGADTGLGKESDRDGNTAYNIDYYMSAVTNATGKTAIILKLDFPDEPEYFKFSKVYLGLDLSLGLLRTAGSGANSENLFTEIKLLHWSGYSAVNVNKAFLAFDGSTTFKNIGTWHYTANSPADNSNFFVIQDPAGTYGSATGYSLYEMTIASQSVSWKEYDSMKQLLLAMGFSVTTMIDESTYTISMNAYELSLMFYSDVTISNELYSPWIGRIYNDSWGSRKVNANMIYGPLDIMEHVLRLQNWNDNNVVAGSEYSSAALINTGTTDGGFDNAEHDTRYIVASRQILNSSDARSGAIIESLCKEFNLCSFQNNIGQECVNSVMPSASDRVVVLSLNDIIPDSISDFEEMSPQYIYCEPYVQYAYNSATDKYDGIIRVTNSSAATFNADYVTGFTGSEAELIWNMAHALYLRYGIVTEPPQERTELKWIRTANDAKQMLIAWLQFMGATTTDGSTYRAANRRRFSFKVPYERAMTIDATHTPWYVSMKFDITLPHQTANVQLQCMVEKIRFDIYEGTAEVSAICFDIASEIQFYVKDTYGSSSPGLDDWKDTHQTQAEAPTNGNDIKNNN